MFNDLPSIDVEDGPFNKQPAYHANSADVESFWAPVDTTYTYMRNISLYGTERSLHQDVLQTPSYPQQLSASHGKPSFISEASTWHNDSPVLKSHLAGGWEPQRLQEYHHLWPHPFPKVRYNSPDGSMGGDRSATELDSSTGGSVWSPRRSVELRDSRYFEPTEAFDAHYFSGSQSQDHGSAPLLVGCSSLHSYPSPPSPRIGNGVALRDVQEFPDGEPEEHMDHFDDEEVKMEQHQSYLEFARPHGCLPEGLHARRNYDEGIGSSIHDGSPPPSMKGEDDISMVDEVKEEDEDDDVSDYTPASRSKRSYPTRKSSMAKSPSSTAKRSFRGKRSPKLAPANKVSKRRTKSTPINPTPPLKPMTTNPTAISTHSNTTSHTCPNCHQTFTTPSAMHKHNLTAHTRPFTCTFGPYGCPSRFGSKNEWKRHVSSQHIQLGLWRCDQGACIPHLAHHRSPSSTSKKRAGPPPAPARGTEKDDVIVVGAHPSDAAFNDFNRKDLFTQHLRRMHAPARSASAAEKEAFEASLEATRRRCWIKTREPPQASVCGYCGVGDGGGVGATKEGVFEGPQSWDERMEHVGRHLEQGHGQREWREDVGLREWMVREGLIVWEGKEGRWVLGGN